ncbi:MAG: hypothetical protein Q7S40_01665 [Opitutaceae bacterium]|nr:hypothetical protein [Opitutaceae bacterium]
MHLRFAALFLLVLAPFARATSVVPPDFPALVAEADAIYRGRVTTVEARRVERPDGGSVIKTFVTLAVQRTLKGTEQKDVTLEFLGGVIGDETLEVSGVPKFTVGQQGIVFVQQNGRQFCPLVRLAHGSYRIAHDASAQKDYVQRDNGLPLNDVDEVELPISETPLASALRADASRALSPADFEAKIVTEIRRPSPSRVLLR